MKNKVSMFYYLIFILLSLKCNGNRILPQDTIQIPSNRMFNNLIRSARYYIKQQSPIVYTVQGHSQTFVKIPGLTMPFYHTQPLLYKIRYEGKCYSPHSRAIWLYLRLMIDDYLLYVNKFLPNTADRYQYLSGYPHNDDGEGGYYWHANSPTVTTCSFNDVIYLKGGLHVIDVGVRGGFSPTSGTFPIYVQVGTFTIEVIEYDPQADIGMSPVNVTLYQN
jgi:hypothetical protein